VQTNSIGIESTVCHLLCTLFNQPELGERGVFIRKSCSDCKVKKIPRILSTLIFFIVFYSPCKAQRILITTKL